VIHSPSTLDAQLSRHADSQDYAQTTVNSQNGPSYGLTPLWTESRLIGGHRGGRGAGDEGNSLAASNLPHFIVQRPDKNA
jgi:hypothetical protein